MEHSKSPEPRKGTRVRKQSRRARKNNTTEKASFVVDTESCRLENIEKEIDENAFLASADTPTFSDITHSPEHTQWKVVMQEELESFKDIVFTK
jgi:hypothetical protein